MKKIKETTEEKLKKVTAKVKIGVKSLDSIIGNVLNSQNTKTKK